MIEYYQFRQWARKVFVMRFKSLHYKLHSVCLGNDFPSCFSHFIFYKTYLKMFKENYIIEMFFRLSVNWYLSFSYSSYFLGICETERNETNEGFSYS